MLTGTIRKIIARSPFDAPGILLHHRCDVKVLLAGLAGQSLRHGMIKANGLLAGRPTTSISWCLVVVEPLPVLRVTRSWLQSPWGRITDSNHCRGELQKHTHGGLINQKITRSVFTRGSPRLFERSEPSGCVALGGEQQESKRLLQIQANNGIGVGRIAVGDSRTGSIYDSRSPHVSLTTPSRGCVIPSFRGSGWICLSPFACDPHNCGDSDFLIQGTCQAFDSAGQGKKCL
jgi:hypothetical protein